VPARQKQGAAGAPAKQQTQQTGLPAIHFASTEHDFGTVGEGDAVQHDFLFENRGEAKLVIGKVVTTCGCTAALASAKELDPGQRGRIQVSFGTRGYKGYQTKSIYVESNDPQSRRVALRLTGFVKRDIDANPTHVYFGNIVPDAVSSQTVRVTSSEGTQFSITKVSATSPLIHLSELREADEGGYEFDVSVGPDLHPGRVSGNIVVETDSPRQPRLTLRVFANVEAPAEESE